MDFYFSSNNNFANLGSFTKVSISVMPLIPWFDKKKIISLDKEQILFNKSW